MTEYAQLFQNRVKQTTATTGTGAVTWNAAVAQFFTFSFGIGVGTPCYYAAASGDGTNFEVGIGTPTANGMTRDVCLSSTNSNNFISLVGVSTFWVDIPASLVNALINMQPGTLLGRGATSVGDVQQLLIGVGLSIVGTTLSAVATGGGISVAGTPLANQIAGWNNAATLGALSIGNNLSLVAGTLAALSTSGISVSGSPTAGQLAAFGNAASILGVTIGPNVSLIGGNTISAASGSGGVSVAGTPLVNQIAGWNNSSTVSALSIGNNLSLTSSTLSAVTPGIVLISATTPTSTATITFTGFPATYTDLVIVIRGRGTAASQDIGMTLQFNGDTGASYDWTQLFIANATSTGLGTSTSAVTAMNITQIAGASALTNLPTASEITIANYADTNFFKSVFGVGSDWSNQQRAMVVAGNWRNTVAIVSIALVITSGLFANGTKVSLYGRN